MTTEPLFELEAEPPNPEVQALARDRGVMPETAPPWGTVAEAAHLAGRCDVARCGLCARGEAMRGDTGC